MSHEIRRDFSSTGLDANGTAIGFDASEDFTMSRDGRSLYFLGTVAGDAAGKVRVKRRSISKAAASAKPSSKIRSGDQ